MKVSIEATVRLEVPYSVDQGYRTLSLTRSCLRVLPARVAGLPMPYRRQTSLTAGIGPKWSHEEDSEGT